ncbi:uncharacterized protein LOC106663167 [Cimex lectularius]|uniref:Uncharacterized protein n=1 Tax=Cimex lectularius TaxID=79782 RepID=A0A8I6RG80_CIMLE|nr:uncharacterized protein LOC106663167 [Cimex lectularius]
MASVSNFEASVKEFCNLGKKYVRGWKHQVDVVIPRMQTAKATCRNYRVVRRFSEKAFTIKFPTTINSLENKIVRLIEQDLVAIHRSLEVFNELNKGLQRCCEIIERCSLENCPSKMLKGFFPFLLMYTEDVMRTSNAHCLQLQCALSKINYLNEESFYELEGTMAKADKLVTTMEDILRVAEGFIDQS